jgi:hypothetical protein
MRSVVWSDLFFSYVCKCIVNKNKQCTSTHGENYFNNVHKFQFCCLLLYTIIYIFFFKLVSYQYGHGDEYHQSAVLNCVLMGCEGSAQTGVGTRRRRERIIVPYGNTIIYHVNLPV